MSKCIIITGCDSSHRELAQDLVESFRRQYYTRYTLGYINFGGGHGADKIRAQVDQYVTIETGFDKFDKSSGYYAAYANIKPRLPDLFPGFSYYVWIDSDCWFSSGESLLRILAGAEDFDICIHPECDVHYLRQPTPSRRTMMIYKKNESHQLSSMPIRMPMLNAGLFCMRAGSRIWSSWQRELLELRRRFDGGEQVYFSDQIPLHKIIYTTRTKIYPIRAIDNWQTYACAPLVNLKSKKLEVPTPPHEEIGVIHLAGQMKDHLVSLDGRKSTLRYRDVNQLFY